MAPIPVKPFVLRDCILAIKDGATAVGEYEAHVSKAQLDPTTPTQSWSGLTPTSVHQDVGATVWTLGLDFAQDYETANSLSLYLLANPGKKVAVELTPKKGAGAKKVTCDVTLMPGSIGGNVGAFATASVTLPVDGQPVVA